ncbi:hypothetical protein M5D96_010011 [Drosophila gunungcola]|uniref:Uncharacterized protein n=1 Tax=Drosophila gunungcola TaxID=103775 RepID=A0A9P9YI84_9MUSC|nr:hypothetical protein M5D96_010011 [Drosophila gunungcola]
MLKTLLLLVVIVSSSWAADYELLLEDPDIFSPCTEPPPGSINFHEAFNIDNLVLNQDADIIHVSENITTNWDVDPNDRISARFALMHFNRGNWEPTLFTMVSQDFCAALFDESQSWFKQWTKHISNRDEVQKKCLKTRDIIMRTLMLLFLGVTSTWATDYELLLEDPDILSPCSDGPPGSIDARQAANFDDFMINADADVLHVSGNVTLTWDVQPTDRIAARLELFHFNRGSWESTVFSMSSQDFCSIMYDKNQYWYKYWTGFITNRHEVEKKCITEPGVSSLQADNIIV